MRQVLLNTNSAVPIILQKIKTVSNVFVKVITKSKDPGQIQLLNNHQQSFSNQAQKNHRSFSELRSLILGEMDHYVSFHIQSSSNTPKMQFSQENRNEYYQHSWVAFFSPLVTVLDNSQTLTEYKKRPSEPAVVATSGPVQILDEARQLPLWKTIVGSYKQFLRTKCRNFLKKSLRDKRLFRRHKKQSTLFQIN